jgi:hypothetical protein
MITTKMVLDRAMVVLLNVSTDLTKLAANDRLGATPTKPEL